MVLSNTTYRYQKITWRRCMYFYGSFDFWNNHCYIFWTRCDRVYYNAPPQGPTSAAAYWLCIVILLILVGHPCVALHGIIIAQDITARRTVQWLSKGSRQTLFLRVLQGVTNGDGNSVSVKSLRLLLVIPWIIGFILAIITSTQRDEYDNPLLGKMQTVSIVLAKFVTHTNISYLLGGYRGLYCYVTDWGYLTTGGLTFFVFLVYVHRLNTLEPCDAILMPCMYFKATVLFSAF